MKKKQIILITGASSGMGKEAALALIKEGHIVYGAARRVEKMKDLVNAGGYSIQMDVTDHESILKGVKKIVTNHGRIDVLWNNAGYAIYGAVEETSLEDARRQFEVNLFGLAAITKEVIPVMRKLGSGKIINTSSMGGKIYTPLGAWYHGTKHALEGWSDSLRLELKQFGIDVILLEPGLIHTEFGDVLMDPLMERSGKGPYSQIAESVKKSVTDTYENGKASKPAVISDIMIRIINSNKPKTRYVAGKMAKPLMWSRKHLGDRIFDWMMMSQVK